MADTTCIICLESKDNYIKFLNCQHKCICVTCFVNGMLSNNLIKKCPICCETIDSSYYYQSDVTVDKCHYSVQNDRIYRYLKLLIKNPHISGSQNIINGVIQLYNSIEKRDDNLLTLLTVNETEELLQIAKDRSLMSCDDGGYKLYNVIVSLCDHPWDVDVALGSHGVCYHGNMGKVPNVYFGIELLLYNQQFLTGKLQYF